MRLCTKRYVITPALCIFLLSIPGLGDTTQVNYAQSIHNINIQLDSLEVQKQIWKRNGQPISELEEKTISLRDSLKILKQKIAETVNITDSSSTPRSNKISFSQVSHPSPIKPKNFFDWIIVIVGGIAIISGIILVLAILKAAFHRKKPQLQNRPSRAVKQSEQPFAHEQVQPAYPTYGPKLDRGINKDPDPFQSLKTRIENDSEKRFDENANKPPFIPPLNPPQETASPDQSGTEAQIIQAAREGLDIQEISRRFHVSTDSVALILKVARVK